MKRLICLLMLSTIFSMGLESQIIYQQDFESGELPSNYRIETNATDNGWNVGSHQSLSSTYFGIPWNGTAGVIGTNDDGCNCDKSEDRLILPALDLSNYSVLSLNFDAYYLDLSFEGAQEEALVQVSTDAVNWTTIDRISGEGSWNTHNLIISEFAGQSEVYISFVYNDNGGWLYGLVLDNIVVEVIIDYDLELTGISTIPFMETGDALIFAGEFFNKGANTINEVEISYSINGSLFNTQTLNGLNIPSFVTSEFEFPSSWVPDTEGAYNILIEIVSVNGIPDMNLDNNSFTLDLQVYPKVERKNIVRDILGSAPVISIVADSDDMLDGPTDLDFFPIMARDELWVINERVADEGGSTLTIYDASTEISDMWLRVDGNAWHFMSLPTGIAFSPDNFNFASSAGVQDANHSGGTFTGPTLWSSDPEIYAQPSGLNGSHLDMLHGSPFGMGIAHEVDNVFWIYDNYNKDIVRYDFVEDHGPGAADHSDGIVRRYSGTGINGDGQVPNNMILDKETGWLYIVDNGNDRVIRLDINSGTSMTQLALINEPLAEHSSVNGFTLETIISDLDKPCGIEMIDNLLLVGEYEMGEIIVYDMDNNFEELGRISTGEAGMTGIKVGPDGSIWYTNYLLNTLNRIEAAQSSSTNELFAGDNFEVFPNPAQDRLTIAMDEFNFTSPITMRMFSVSGLLVKSQTINTKETTIFLDGVAPGTYLIELQSDNRVAHRKITVTD